MSNTTQIVLNVDPETFQNVVEEGIKALPKEKLQELIIEGIGEYLRSNNYENVEKLFIDKKDKYGYKDIYAKPVMEKLVADCDYSKLQDVVDAAIDSLKADYEKILTKTITGCIIDGLTDQYKFREAVREAVREVIMLNNNN